MRRTALALAAAAAVSAALAYPANAQPADVPGTPGFCPDDEGTTVVVDFGDLGDDVIVRCAPGDEDRDGLDALRDAGFDVEGVQRYGDSVACRIEGRPAPDEPLRIAGRGGYREACIDMPPSSAYWSYWSADDGGDWAYSQWGLQSRDAINGGFEGWSFSLNGTTATRTAPRIDPVRPDAPSDDDESDSSPSDEQPRDRSETDGDPQRTDPDTGELPMPKRREASPPPTTGSQDGVRWTGRTSAAEPETTAADDAASGTPAVAAAAVIGCLAVLIAVTALRRRSRRT